MAKSNKQKIETLLDSAEEKGNAENWQGAIDDLGKAHDLGENSINLWTSLGYANYQLGNYDKAGKNYNKALELNPDDPDTIRLLKAINVKKAEQEAAEQIKESAKEQTEVFEGNSQELLDQSDERIDTMLDLQKEIKSTQRSMIRVTIIYLIIIGFLLYSNKVVFNTNLYLQIPPLLAPLFVILFPFIWNIRMLLAIRDKNEIMREDYYRWAIADVTIRKVFGTPGTPSTPEQKEQRLEAWRKYIDVWLHNSSAEMLLRYRNKKISQEESHPTEEIIREMRELVTGDKGDKGNTP